MSSEITEAFVKQFSASVFHLSQQKGSRLRGAVRNESQQSKEQFWDRIGEVAAVKRVSRHSDTPQIDTPHSRRRVTLVDYEWADLIDNQDKIRMLLDPASDYAQAAMWAMGRAMDDQIIEKAFGTAYAGEEGATSVALGNSEKRCAFDGSSTTGVDLNVQSLRAAKKYFDGNDVDESIPRHAAISAEQLESLLGETEVTSSDFNSVRALVNGEVNTFLGFNFIRIERLLATAATTAYQKANGLLSGSTDATAAASSRRCMFWAQDGILMSLGEDMMARIDERSDKSYSTQVYARMSVGAVRMEEKKFLELICEE